MKLSNDQRNVIKAMALYALVSIIVFPVYHLIKGNFCWADTLFYGAGILIVEALVGLFFVLGLKSPEK